MPDKTMLPKGTCSFALNKLHEVLQRFYDKKYFGHTEKSSTKTSCFFDPNIQEKITWY